jgi:hemoglobin
VTDSAYDRVGGEVGLRAIIDDFVDRVFADAMIGFMFGRVDRERLKQLEFEHAAAHLGGPVQYTGRPLAKAHAPHRIFGGQFDRRAQILRSTLERHRIPADIRDAWLAHVESLRPQITRDAAGECED